MNRAKGVSLMAPNEGWACDEDVMHDVPSADLRVDALL